VLLLLVLLLPEGAQVVANVIAAKGSLCFYISTNQQSRDLGAGFKPPPPLLFFLSLSLSLVQKHSTRQRKLLEPSATSCKKKKISMLQRSVNHRHSVVLFHAIAQRRELQCSFGHCCNTMSAIVVVLCMPSL